MEKNANDIVRAMKAIAGQTGADKLVIKALILPETSKPWFTM
jgi:hypothetical protein